MSKLGQGFVTVTQLVKVGEESVLALHTNILPCSMSSMGESSSVDQAETQTKSLYAWFDDLLNQRLLAFAHDVLHAKATENIRAEFEGGTGYNALPTSTTRCSEGYHFRSSGGLRGLFMFKPSTFRHNIIVSKHTSAPTTPCVAFVTDYGRQVLPFLSAASTGRGYNSYKVLPESLHAFVDNHEMTSTQGIFKVLSSLDPNHNLPSDVSVYFNKTNIVVSEQTDRGNEDFPEVPVAGLRYRPSKRKAKSFKHISKRAKIDKNVTKLSNQPIISEVLVKECQEKTTGPSISFNKTTFPPNVKVIEESSGFVSELEYCASNATICIDNDPCIVVNDDLSRDEILSNPISSDPPNSVGTTANSSQFQTSANKIPNDLSPPIQMASLEDKHFELIGINRKGSPVAHDDENRLSDCKLDDVTINHSAQPQQNYLETPSSDNDDFWLIDTPSSCDLEHTEKAIPISSSSSLQIFNDIVSKTSSVTAEHDNSIDQYLTSGPTNEMTLDDVTNESKELPTLVLSGSSNSSVASTRTTSCSQASDFILVTSDNEPEIECTGVQEGRKCTTGVLTLEEIIGGAN